MIVLFCLLILGLGYCDDLPSKFEVENSINRTINEVERLIRENSTLPRLTRREIIDILFNITSKDLETYQNKETIEKARKIYQRALMVVLPYNAENVKKENINDLYTKPPIVQIIADPSSKPIDFKISKNKISQLNTSTQESLPAETQYKNHREMYSEVNTNMPLKLDSAPIKFSFNLDNLQRQQMITEEPVTSRQPVYQGSSSTKDEEVHIVYSTSATTMHTVDTSSKDVSKFDQKDSQITHPLKYNQNVLSSEQWRYNAPPSTTQRIMTTSSRSPDLFSKEIRDIQSFLPTKISLVDVMTPTMTSKIEDILKISKGTSESTQMANTEEELASPIYVTPISSSAFSDKSKYNFTYNLNSEEFRRNATTTMRPKIMELLASIGLRPENATNVEEVFNKKEREKSKDRNNMGIKFQIPSSNGFHTTTSALTAAVPDSPSIIGQNTFENSILEIGKGMNNLTPDVQLLFQRFGLHTSDPTRVTTTSMLKPLPTVNTNSYTNFKPLPMSKAKDQDMKEFLAKFGLGVSDNRQQKAMRELMQQPSLIEAVPDNMRQILENIGLISHKVSTKMAERKETERPETTKLHVFKPHEVRLEDEEQKIKISELLDTVKLFQEGKASVKDVRRIANNLLETTKNLKNGPDPLSLEEIINIYNEDLKNEVKRQQPPEEFTTNSNQDLASTSSPSSTTTDISSTTTTTAISTTSDSIKEGSDFLDTLTSTTEASTSARTNLIALEESFGGTTRAPDPVLPAKRKNGLYIMVDWNTFLEVGDESSEKVNLRFQPKVGDRARFLPVTVP